MTKTSAIVVCSLLVLFLGGLVFQRCSFDRQLAASQAQSTKADAQLVTTTEQLATEQVAEAKTQAVTRVRAAVAHAREEVTRAESDSDLADYLDAAVRDADSRGGD